MIESCTRMSLEQERSRWHIDLPRAGRFASAAITITLAIATTATSLRAQPSETWPPPQKISSPGHRAQSFPTCLADDYGNVHVVWAGDLGDATDATLLYYARFDGVMWSQAADILAVRGPMPKGAELAIDSEGFLHAVRSTGRRGALSRIVAHIEEAGDAQGWMADDPIPASGDIVRYAIDRQDRHHLVYSALPGDETQLPGFHYISSADGGATWTSPLHLSPDVPEEVERPSMYLELALGPADDVHVVWTFGSSESGLTRRVLQHTSSRDGGRTWSPPATLDTNEDDPDALDFADPQIAAGDAVLMTWLGRDRSRREYAYSLDGGQSWSPAAPFFGELEGAAGDALVMDASGEAHYLAQARYPQALYHARWTEAGWTEPEVAYFITGDSREPIGVDVSDRIHVHRVCAALRDGHQLVTTFTDSPSSATGGLFAMARSLPGLEPRGALPVPTVGREEATAVPAVPVEAQVGEDASATPPRIDVPGVSEKSLDWKERELSVSPRMALLAGLVPLVMLIGWVLVRSRS